MVLTGDDDFMKRMPFDAVNVVMAASTENSCNRLIRVRNTFHCAARPQPCQLNINGR